MLRPVFILLFLLTIIVVEGYVAKRQDAQSPHGVDNGNYTLNNTSTVLTNLNLDNAKDIRDTNNDHTEYSQAKLVVDGDIMSEENLPARNKRSSPSLMRLLRVLFTKPSTTTVADVDDVNTTTYRTTHMPIRSDGIHDYTEDEDRFVDFQDLLRQIYETLKKLDDKLSHDLPENNKRGFLTIKIPINFDYGSRHRLKREIAAEKSANATTKLDDATVNANLTLADTANFTIETNDTHLRKSQQSRTDEVIFKIDSALKDVQKEISDMKMIKHAVTSDEIFKVGYIVANLENLELTLKKLAKRVHTRRNRDGARKYLGDVELSKKIVVNLMEYLRLHRVEKD